MATDNKDNKLSLENSDYAEILQHAVAVIEHARTEIARHINGYVSTAYWEIGQMLHERKIESGYGDSVVRRLSADLKERYPKMGVSPRQLWNMKKFYERYAGHDEKVLRAVALLPWSHNLLLLSKGFNDETTLYYAQETITKGWNRDLLLNAIKLKMYETQALARVDNNFDRTLPAEQAQCSFLYLVDYIVPYSYCKLTIIFSIPNSTCQSSILFLVSIYILHYSS